MRRISPIAVFLIFAGAFLFFLTPYVKTASILSLLGNSLNMYRWHRDRALDRSTLRLF